MDKIHFSKETQRVLTTKKGYRNNSYGVSGVMEIRDVVQYEMKVNGNTDIPEFMEVEYDLNVNLTDLNERLQEGKVSDSELTGMLDNIQEKVREVMGDIDVFCLWLSTREGIEENYNGKEDGMTCYDLSGVDLMPISDLADEGTLFVMDRHPNTLPFNEVDGLEV